MAAFSRHKKKKNLKYQFDSFTRRIVVGGSSAIFVGINSIFSYRKSIVDLLFLLQRFLLKQFLSPIEIAILYSNS